MNDFVPSSTSSLFVLIILKTRAEQNNISMIPLYLKVQISADLTDREKLQFKHYFKEAYDSPEPALLSLAVQSCFAWGVNNTLYTLGECI